MEAVYGGIIDQIVINNISMTGACEPRYSSNLENRKYQPAPGHIVISNITVTSNSLIPSSITGALGHDVEKIALQDIMLISSGGKCTEGIRSNVLENAGGYPGNVVWGAFVGAWAFPAPCEQHRCSECEISMAVTR